MGQNVHHHTRRSRRKRRVSADINITPLVDVMLVLLIVFMVSAPLMITGKNLDLPKTQSEAVSTEKQPIVISVDKAGKVYVAETEMSLQKLKATLVAIYKRTPDSRVFLRGDTNANYGAVIKVMTEIRTIGFTKISLITEEQ